MLSDNLWSRVKWMPWQCQKVKGMTFNLKVMAAGSGRHRHRWKTAHSNLHSTFPGGIMLCVQNRKTV